MSSIINDAIINININNNINNFIGLKLSGKGINDNSNINNNYDYNGIGINLWSNREIAFIDTSNSNNTNYANIRFGIISNIPKMNGSTSMQINNNFTILNNRIGIETLIPKSSLHVKNNILLSGSIVDLNNNIFNCNLWVNNSNKLYYNKGYIGIGLTNPNSLLDIANSRIILSSNYKISIGKINPQNALDIFNNDVNINNGAIFCSLSNSKLSVGNINPQSALDIRGDISLSGSLLNIDGTPYTFKTLNPEQWSNSPNNLDNIYYNLGNVGIGTTNPQSSSLYVNGNIQLDGNIIMSNGIVLNSSPWNDITINNSNYIYANNYKFGIGINEPQDLLHLSLINSNLYIRFTDATTGQTNNDGFIIGLDSNDNGLLWNYENSSLIFGTSNRERLKITNNGFIGIGTTNPQSLLHLSSCNVNTNVFININDDLIIGKDSNQNSLLWNNKPTDLIFGTNNEEKLRIKSINFKTSYISNIKKYPPKTYTSSTNINTVNDILNGRSVYTQTITLDTANISYGYGEYIIYVSSIYDDNNDIFTIKHIFNNNIIDYNCHFALNQYDLNNGNYIGNNYIKSDYLGDWVIIKLPYSIILKKYIFYARIDLVSRSPGEWTVYGSIDGNNFIKIDAGIANQSDYINNKYEKNINNNINYLYYGFVINKLALPASSTLLNFAELELYGYENSDILIINEISSNIGIGTDNPNALLHLYNKSQNTLLTLSDQGTINSNIQIGRINDNNLIFWNSNNTPITFRTNNIERLRIANNGNIGIGNNNPLSLLHLTAATTSTTIGIKLCDLNTNNSNNGFFINKDNQQNGVIWNYEDASIIFGNNNTETMRINANIKLPNQNNFFNLFNTKKPYAMYFAEDYDNINKILPDSSGNKRHATTSSGITKTASNENGALSAINYIYGDVNASILFPTNSIPSTFTIASLTKYNGDSYGRILQSTTTSPQFIHGHHHYKRGICYYDEWKTLQQNKGLLRDWVCCIGKNSGNIPGNILIDGVALGVSSGGNGNCTLCINSSTAYEYSDWAFSCVIIWDIALDDTEMVLVNTLIDYYKSIGFSLRNYITSLFNSSNAYNIGLGTNNPNALLHLYKSGTLSQDVLLNFNDQGTSAFQIGKTNNDNTIFWNSNNTPMTLRTNNIERLRIANNGNIGIGNNNPISLLHLSSTLTNTNVSINLNELIIGKDNLQNGVIWNNNNAATIFGTNNIERIRILTNNNIGIGINNPNALLHIYKSGTLSQNVLLSFNDQGTTAFQIGKQDDNNMIFWNSNNTPMTFRTNNIERLRITNNGNIGIGNNNPISLLHLTAATTNTNVSINLNGLIIGKDNLQNGMLFNSNNAATIFGTNNIERIRILTNSNIGIGINNPNALLHLYKSGTLSQDVLLSFNDQGTTNLQIGKQDNNNMIFWNSNNTQITFRTNNIERLRIANNGNIGIGVLNPQYLLDVNNNINIEGGLAIGSSSAFINNTNVDNDNTSNTYLILKQAGTVNDWCYIRQTGGNDNLKLSFDFYDNTDSRFSIRSIIPTSGTDTVKEVFSVDITDIYANGLRLNGENTTDTIMQLTGDLGLTVNNENNNKISFYNSINEIANITNDNININNVGLFIPTNYNFASLLLKNIYGGNADAIILYQGSASAYPYSIGQVSSTISYSIPDNCSHKFYIAGIEYMNINNTSTIIYNNIIINNASSPGINFSSFGISAIGIAGGNGAYSSSASTGDMVIRTIAGNEMILQTGNTEGHLIIRNGKIGIGTDNPISTLDVRKDNIRLNGNIYNADGTLYKIDKGTFTSLTSTNLIMRTNIEASIVPSYTDGNNKYYLFENDGTITFNKTMTADILLVGAGGNGGLGYFSGGGGAGEVIYYPKYTFAPGTYNLAIGKNDYTNYYINCNVNNIKLAIGQNSSAIVNNSIKTLFANKKPWGCYFAEDFSENRLSDSSGNNRHATTTGTITKTTASGNGATGNITYISGTTASTLSFPSGSIPSTFTILSLTRYTGGTTQRILISLNSGNWFHGHWSGNRGTCYYDGWNNGANVGTLTDWVCCIGKNTGNTPGNILVDGIGYGSQTGGTGGGTYQLGINTGIGFGSSEQSDWALSCVIIWDQALTDVEMKLLNDIIDNYRSTGIYYSTNRNSLITLGTQNIITAKGGGDGGTTGIFVTKKPWGCYFAEDFSGSTLFDSSGNNRHATSTGTITKATASGNGAAANITYISGGTSSILNFPIGSIPATFTILSLTRYTGGSRQRILQGAGVNWMHGHHADKRGICYYGNTVQFLTPVKSIGNIDDWLCCIGKNNATYPNNILIDGVGNSIKNGGDGNGTLKINAGDYSGESSDWALSCVMIWDQALTDQEMINLNNIVKNYLLYGLSIKNNFITTIPTIGGSGGGGYTSNSIITSGASSGLKWNNSYSYINNGQSGTILSGGNGGSALPSGNFTEQITENNLKIGKGGLGISNIDFNLFTTKKNYGDGGDGGGGIGANGIIIIKQNITNALISTDYNMKTLNVNNINNSFYNLKNIYPTCSCNLNYIDNSNYGYYLITSTTDITFTKDTIVELLLVGYGGNGGIGANSGGGGAGNVVHYPKYLFTIGTYNISFLLRFVTIFKKNNARSFLLQCLKGNDGLYSNLVNINVNSGSGGGGYSNIHSANIQTRIGDYRLAPIYNNSLNNNNPYTIYANYGTNGTLTSGGNGGSALVSGAYVENMTGTFMNVGIGGNGAIGNSTPIPKTTYGSGGDGNGGLGTDGLVIIKFPIEKINVFNGYQTTNDNNYLKILDYNFKYNNEVQLDYYYNKGNVGIGISNPISLLHVNSNICLSGNINNFFLTPDLIISTPNYTSITVGDNINSNIMFTRNLTSFANQNVSITGNLTVSGNITVTSSCNISINGGGSYRANNIALTSSSTNFSDNRIKTNITDINSYNASLLISNIMPKIYNYIDKEERGDVTVYGFIAQQIHEVIPPAVQTITEFIPNIYKSFIYSNNEIITDEDLTMQLSINDRIKIKDADNYYKIVNITNITSNTITLNTSINGSNCFIYGKEVKDFHILDKSYIYTTNIGSTQNLYEIVKKQEQQLLELNNVLEQQEVIFNEISQSLNLNI